MNTRNLDQLYAAGLRLHEAGQAIAGTFATPRARRRGPGH